MQIFQVLTKIGAKHDFSAGLLIGGKQILDEKETIGRMNILVRSLNIYFIFYLVFIYLFIYF